MCNRAARPQDAHDIIGTHRIVSDPEQMRLVPTDFAAFERLLVDRHAGILEGRPHRNPGEYKQRHNQAGGTILVDPDLVRGTFAQGFERYRLLTPAFARAAYMMFVSEVHPFADGNGRVARVMMNAELFAAGEQRIIIPTVYRDNYLAGLRGMTANRHADGFIATLAFAQRYHGAIDWSTQSTARDDLGRTNAFRDPPTSKQASYGSNFLIGPDAREPAREVPHGLAVTVTTTTATATHCARRAKPLPASPHD